MCYCDNDDKGLVLHAAFPWEFVGAKITTLLYVQIHKDTNRRMMQKHSLTFGKKMLMPISGFVDMKRF